MVMLQTNERQWISNKNSLKQMVVKYFDHVFTSEPISVDHSSLPNLFPSLDARDSQFLCKKVEDLEVKETLFNIGVWKAPGSDGIPSAFFQKYWDFFGSQICYMAIQVFGTGHLPKGINYLYYFQG